MDTSGNATNSTNTTINLIGYGDGRYNITVQATDDLGNTRNGSIIIFIDTTKPGIVLNYPIDTQNFTTTSLTLNFTATDNLDPSLTCNLTIDGAINRSNFEAASGNVTNTSITSMAEGTHYWNVTCWDNASNTNTSATISFNIYIAPHVNLTRPVNNNISNNATQIFYFNVSDDTGIFNCTLYLNGAPYTIMNQTDIVNNAMNNRTIGGLDGTYNWSVQCFDSTALRMSATSEVWNLTIDIYAPSPNITTANYT